MALRIDGTIVALDAKDPERFERGRVWLGDDGLIDSVTHDGDRTPSGFSAAPRVDVGDSWVFPGVIDLHNHIGYNTLPLWTEPSQTTPFEHHNDWTDENTYQPSISWPAQTLAKCEPEALLAYVETKALVGGTTAIQGSPTTNRPRDGVLVRNIDDEAFAGTDRNLIYTSALTVAPAELRERAARMAAGRGFIYHCAEGKHGSTVTQEYDAVVATGCLQERLMAVHCTAIADFSDWRPHPGAVVWSPFSNLWLYGVTTDIAAVRAAKVTVCLGSDWGPSGTKHVLAELKVAATCNQLLQLGLSSRELVEMVTANPGDMLARCWPHPPGRITRTGLADLTVVTRQSTDPWKDLIATRERDVLLVVVGGYARYGDRDLMAAAKTTPVGAITVAGQSRRISIPDPADPARQWSWQAIKQRLNVVRQDPAAALAAAERKRNHRDTVVTARAEPEPLELALDMPFGGSVTAKLPDDKTRIKIPPLDSIVHDAAFLRSIRGRGFHGGILDSLSNYYAS